MQLRTNKFVAFSALAALGAAGLFAQQRLAARAGQREGRPLRVMSAVLNLTDAQQTQVKSIFQDARKSAQPVRQQLMSTRQSLEAAVQAGDADQIQQLSATVGNATGQLTAIRSSAFAKIYKTLTPDQQQKWGSLQQAMHPRGRPASRPTGE
ncbi:MAG: Spy/CpxP family protein refolding chaperone [Acidobacteriia bacterium]|nr:Spy/CpxP family protein refolding chaperone [Terriglobia bacterium]